MIKYILIVILFTGSYRGGVDTHHVVFDNQEACLHAASLIDENVKLSKVVKCVPQQ